MTQESQQPTESMNFHLCTESPCPLQDKECADILNNAMSTNYTQQPTDKQKWWWEKRFYNQFKRYILHGLSPVGEFEDSYDFNKLKSFISHVAEEERRRSKYEILKWVKLIIGYKHIKEVERLIAEDLKSIEQNLNS